MTQINTSIVLSLLLNAKKDRTNEKHLYNARCLRIVGTTLVCR